MNTKSYPYVIDSTFFHPKCTGSINYVSHDDIELCYLCWMLDVPNADDATAISNR